MNYTCKSCAREYMDYKLPYPSHKCTRFEEKTIKIQPSRPNIAEIAWNMIFRNKKPLCPNCAEYGRKTELMGNEIFAPLPHLNRHITRKISESENTCTENFYYCPSCDKVYQQTPTELKGLIPNE